MAKYELVLPKMGEGIIEATINKWLKEVGDKLNEDDAVVEVATDKVDSEVPSPVEGVLIKLMFEEGEVAPVGDVIAIIETDGDDDDSSVETAKEEKIKKQNATKPVEDESKQTIKGDESKPIISSSKRFLSPLVKSIAKEEGISVEELENIKGSGKDNRLVKRDVLEYIKNRTTAKKSATVASTDSQVKTIQAPPVSTNPGDEVIEMDRMRRLIADHMVMSSHVSPHVTSFIDVDVTNIVNWRNKIKDAVLKREGEKITFTPVFINAIAHALKEYPQVNASLDGYKVILRKRINVGMAAALPNGNLIVPVIKDAEQKNILGLAKSVNDLAKRSRENKLQPDEIQNGTFTVTNFGSFDSLSGTPIINQPQVAILGVGAIRKKPVVIETEGGDVIGIRHIMILSMAYDHRIVDGALGGMFLRRVKQLLENFDINTVI
ncbi:MAG: diapophytoene dehydrogenase [Marinilabiliales bacterium]|nr:MAG: diapophytoene dehydrogenase [Marinilabiliales bacterium]